jgi:hypothetical protein
VRQICRVALEADCWYLRAMEASSARQDSNVFVVMPWGPRETLRDTPLTASLVQLDSLPALANHLSERSGDGLGSMHASRGKRADARFELNELICAPRVQNRRFCLRSATWAKPTMSRT